MSARSASADDVDTGDVEGVGAAHDGADVEVLADVLDGDVQPVGAGGQIGADRRDGPVAVAVDDVAPVAVRQQLAVVAGVGGPGVGACGPGTDADLTDVGRPVLLLAQRGRRRQVLPLRQVGGHLSIASSRRDMNRTLTRRQTILHELRPALFILRSSPSAS